MFSMNCFFLPGIFIGQEKAVHEGLLQRKDGSAMTEENKTLDLEESVSAGENAPESDAESSSQFGVAPLIPGTEIRTTPPFLIRGRICPEKNPSFPAK